MRSINSLLAAGGAILVLGTSCSGAFGCEPMLGPTAVPGPAGLHRVPTTHPVHGKGAGKFNVYSVLTPDTSGPAPAAPGKYEAFMQNLDNKVRSNWNPNRKQEFRAAIFNFTVHKNGEISDIVETQHANNKQADDAALLALHRSSPVSPLPSGPATVKVKFVFENSNGSSCCCGGNSCTCARPGTCGSKQN